MTPASVPAENYLNRYKPELEHPAVLISRKRRKRVKKLIAKVFEGSS